MCLEVLWSVGRIAEIEPSAGVSIAALSAAITRVQNSLDLATLYLATASAKLPNLLVNRDIFLRF